MWLCDHHHHHGSTTVPAVSSRNDFFCALFALFSKGPIVAKDPVSRNDTQEALWWLIMAAPLVLLILAGQMTGPFN